MSKFIVVVFVALALDLAGCQVYLQPEQIHLALGETDQEMVVTWMTQNLTKTSIVEYGPNVNMETTSVGKATLFQDGGPAKRKMYVHRATMYVKPGNAYYYHVGSPVEAWSSVFYFKMPKRSNETWSPRLAVFGDLGNINSRSMAYLQADVQRGKYDGIIHVGDFAYDLDTNNAKVGDEFMRMIEAVAGYVPYMVCPGNHENAYFNMGPAHFVGFSTELYYYVNFGWEQIVTQWNWLINDLKEANKPENRKTRPWIITFGHRPMYCTNNDRDDCTRDENLIRKGLPFIHLCGLEDLFFEYGVDFEIWAHEHAFERLWPTYNRRVINGTTRGQPYKDAGAPVHVTTGSAGCKERTDDFQKHAPTWSAFRSTDYGYSTLFIANKTHLHFEQFSIDQDKVVDEFWVVKSQPYPSYYGSLHGNWQGQSPFRAASPELGFCQLH